MSPLVLLALVGFVAAGTPTITFCSGPRAIMQGPRYTLAPNNIASDENLTIDVYGTLTSTVSDGSIQLDVWADGVHILSQDLDLCETAAKGPFPCPFNQGALHLHYVAEIPLIPVAGKVSATAEIKTKAGVEVVCAQGSVYLLDAPKKKH